MTDTDSPLELDKDGRATPVTDAETALLAAVKTGELADIPDAPEPAEANGWTDQHTLRATFLRHLCLNPTLYAIDPKGVLLYGARIAGALDFQAATLTRPLWVFASRFEGEVILQDAQTRSLGFGNCHLTKFSADRLSVTGTLKLAGSTIIGATRLLGATISGNLDCTGATFTHEGKDAFSAICLKTGGGVFLKNVTVTGATLLVGADITGDLTCSGAIFTHEGNDAFNADRLKIGGVVFLNEATVTGETRLLGADITGNLECNGATFTHEGKDAFTADGLKIGGSMFLKEASVTGATRLVGANITGNLECDGASFTHEGKDAFTAQRLVVGGRFFWRGLACPPKGDIHLTHARIGDFVDDGSGWPEEDAGHLFLDGLCYDTIGLDTTATMREEWLARMPSTEDGEPDGKPAFFPQPYEQLIKVLRAAGHDADARLIAIAKQDAYDDYLLAQVERSENHADRQWAKFNAYVPTQHQWRRRLSRVLAKYTIGYGYRPWLPLKWIGAIILLGAVVYGYADDAKYMHIAKERVYLDKSYKKTHQLPAEYPPFNALVFSIDTMIPFVDLHQEAYWEPKADGFWGGMLRLFFWVHIAAGWVFATLAAAGLSGVIKKD